ncbi:hypothetical protein [Halobacteriovorax sp.]|uniref:hypothetical protein n=1 Tax=Halobacteriovorax sp. TaxID=2020862 RepID=UPI0035697BD6
MKRLIVFCVLLSQYPSFALDLYKEADAVKEKTIYDFVEASKEKNKNREAYSPFSF